MDDTTGSKPPASHKPGGSGLWMMLGVFFTLHIANPFVRMILRSPLHGMLSGWLALISYWGRQSGKEYTLPVHYVLTGDTIYIVPGGPEQKTWWRNLRDGATVQLGLHGQKLSGMAQVLMGDTDGAAIADVLVAYFQRFPAAARMHAVSPEPGGTYNVNDLQKAAASVAMVRVMLNPQAHG